MLSVCVFPIWGSHSCITGVTINKHQEGKQLYICASLYSLQPCVSMLRLLFNSLDDSRVSFDFAKEGWGKANSELFLLLSSLHLPLRRCPNWEEKYKIWNNILIWLLLLGMASDQGMDSRDEEAGKHGVIVHSQIILGKLIVICPNSYFHI